MRNSVTFFIISLVSIFSVPIFPQDTSNDLLSSVADRSAVLAREEFRRGVQAYNRYGFNEAILSFEKALSYRPSEPLILEWLGRAYYRSGLEDTALRQWQLALSHYDPTSSDGLLLSSRVETVRNQRSLYPEVDENARYVDAGRYPGKNEDIVLYKQPTSILPLQDGSVWVVAYGSNEVIRIDPNGMIHQRLRGPVNGFDRPYDIVRGVDGRLYVSEYKGNRISILDERGEWMSYIGAAGRGDGQFIGPQNLAVDEQGYLYVVDFGNRRVSKFDPDGKFVLSFGNKKASFPGFHMPTGIAAREGEVFVADADTRRILRFDDSGNFLGVLAEGNLSYPESLRFDDDNRLIVADTNRVVLLDPGSGLIRELGSLGNANVRIVGADVDRNGNIVVANFAAGEVALLARIDDLAAGLFVQIERVISDRFPDITLEVRVQDRRRRPIVGLSESNFILSEEGRPVVQQKLLGAAYLSQKEDISFLIERSLEITPFVEDIVNAVKDAASTADHVVSFVSASEQPVKERIDSESILFDSARGKKSIYSPRWKFDVGLRLAATDLLAGEKKRAVVFVTTGHLGERAFDRYGLSELAAYLANNGITFFAALIGDQPPDRELVYLCEQTGGRVVSVYRPEGLTPAIASLRESPNGSYSLKYRSSLPTDFGRAYLPIEVEAYLLDRSGRDSIGYFPPLE